LAYTAGPFFVPNAFGNTIPAFCDPTGGDPTAPCDVYRLTVTLPENFATTNPNQSVFARVEWGTPAADFDLYLWEAESWAGDGLPTGSPIAQSKQTATNFEQVEIPAVGGTRELVVQVSPTSPAGQSFTGKIFIGPAGSHRASSNTFRVSLMVRRPQASDCSRPSRQFSAIPKPAARS
jgi:hypothetical protein